MKLYKKDSKGKIRLLDIHTKGADLIQISGLVDGKHVENKTTCKGKNIGKSNETSPQEQAVSEMESKIAKKLREGYFKTKEEAEASDIKLPMLAHDYKKHKDKLVFLDDKGDRNPVYVQPKFDGMRCFAICSKGVVKLISRDNVLIDTVPHINTSILLHVYREGSTFDGELYCHGENFQTNMSMIRNGDKNIKFFVYDFPMEEEYTVRKLMLDATFKNKEPQFVEHAYTELVRSMQDVKDFHAKALADGFEGTIIRQGREPYVYNKRTTQLLKYKDFKDIACKIIHIGPADRRPEWGRPVVEWTAPNGEVVRFACNPKMTHEQKEDLLKNKDKYIGKTAEVRYFEEYESGVPRFPVMVGIRNDKSK